MPGERWLMILPELGLLDITEGALDGRGGGGHQQHTGLSGTRTTSLCMCVTHLSTQPGVFLQLQGRKVSRGTWESHFGAVDSLLP